MQLGSMYNLSEFNISLSRVPLDHPQMAQFVGELTRINSLAEASPGFVWRLQTDTGDATAVRAFGDPRVLVNLSVWRSIESLVAFTYHSPHAAIYKRRREWFDANPEASLCLWWLPDGKLPTIREAEERLAYLRTHGASPFSFSLAVAFSADGSPHRSGFDR